VINSIPFSLTLGCQSFFRPNMQVMMYDAGTFYHDWLDEWRDRVEEQRDRKAATEFRVLEQLLGQLLEHSLLHQSVPE
jgi:hypothetical protein